MAEPMVTRKKRPNYAILENGLEALSGEENSLSDDDSQSQAFQSSFFTARQSETNSSINIPSSEVQPSESASQPPATVSPDSTKLYTAPLARKRKRLATATDWIWEHFETINYNREWTARRTQKHYIEDRDISANLSISLARNAIGKHQIQ
jgi:hypothetical protein